MDINQWIHFSIDDVILSLKWVYEHAPDSIFEEPLFGKLKEWNNKYGLFFHLYLLDEYEGFQLSDLQNKYWNEIREKGTWLKLWRHGRNPGELINALKEETRELFPMDLSLDPLTADLTVEDMLEQTEKKLCELRLSKALHISCKECKLGEAGDSIERYLTAIKTIRLPLYLNASTLNGNQLYFAACNNSYLFKLDIDTNKLDTLCRIKSDTSDWLKFSALFFYKGNIWMIPWRGEKIYIYKISRNEKCCCGLSHINMRRKPMVSNTGNPFRMAGIFGCFRLKPGV